MEEEGPALEMKEGNKREYRTAQSVHNPSAFLNTWGPMFREEWECSRPGVGQSIRMEMMDRSQKLHSDIPGGQSQSPWVFNSGYTLKSPQKCKENFCYSDPILIWDVLGTAGRASEERNPFRMWIDSSGFCLQDSDHSGPTTRLLSFQSDGDNCWK